MKKSTIYYTLLTSIFLTTLLTVPLHAAEPNLPDLGGPTVPDDAAVNNLDDGSGIEESPAPDDLQPVPEPPEIPQAVQSGEPLEPEVTIIQRENETIEESRINGRLYKVKITPKAGPPYYLVDTDGDGVLETRGNNDITDINIPQWVLFSW